MNLSLHGQQLIGKQASSKGSTTFQAVQASDHQLLATAFYEATAEEISQAVELGTQAFGEYRRRPASKRADFLDQIAAEIMALGDPLIDRCHHETALPLGRLMGERGRTVNQLKLFASVVREGSWVEARIDTAQPDRTPVPKPDIRSMSIPLGPVAVFGASNFPLAFSIAGGDTASALAAGCPVIAKGHPAHPGTCELVGRAILLAAEKTGMPDGVFSLIQGKSITVGQTLVKHPLLKAVGFTGSFRGGKAIFDTVMQRPEPIPVYAEMGSTNPVFVLPGALAERAASIAQGLAASINLGVGQFCTNPGLVLGAKSQGLDQFSQELAAAIQEQGAGTMLTPGIRQAFEQGTETLASTESVELLGKQSNGAELQVLPQVWHTNTQQLKEQPHLGEEVFGPSSILVAADSQEALLDAARNLQGHLTATIHGTEADLAEHQALIHILQEKVGRLIFNAFPTGVEVCPSMVHGGPFPATTHASSTSVGTLAIQRFARPFCYQGFPDTQLPPELQANNPLGIWRMVDGIRGKR
ncbi:MAG: aldehyde dehydrogenase (NADP(+)) [Bacteroidota bacterium]